MDINDPSSDLKSFDDNRIQVLDTLSFLCINWSVDCWNAQENTSTASL